MNRTLHILAPGRVEVRDSAMPERRSGEALLKLLYGGICGSDLGTYRGTYAYVTYPRIPGHEIAAEVVEIDDNPQGLKPGSIVTVNPYFNCGTCYSCRRGLVNCCENNQTLGCQRDGAYSKFCTLPVERLYDGKGVPARQLALIEPYCISEHGVQRADVRASDKVLVIGAGTIGMFALIAARSRGACVYVRDVSATKLKMAEELGAAGTLPVLPDRTLAEQVKDITGGDGFDVTIEAVGLASTFQDCIDAAAFGGRVVLIGISKQNLDFAFTIIQRKELNIYGSRNALKADFLRLIDVAANEQPPIERLITNVFPFEKAAEAFQFFDANQSRALKVMLEF